MLAQAKRQLIRLASLGFVLRALVPAGFMPASLADGGPFVVCHGGIAGAVLVELAAASRHSSENDADRGRSGGGPHGVASYGDASDDHSLHGGAADGHAAHGDATAHAHGHPPASVHGGTELQTSPTDGAVAAPAGGESHPHAGGDATGGLHEAWDNCPVGSLLVTAAILDAAVDVPLLDLAHVLNPRAPFAPITVPATAPYDARGPPAPLAS